MTFPANTPQGGQPRTQRSTGSARTAGQQSVSAPISPDEIDFSQLMEEQFQVALAEEEEQLVQERRQRLYIIIGIAAAVLILVFAVVATIFGWWPVVLDLVLVIVVLINGVMLGFLGWAILTVIRTIREMRAEITPVIGSLAETATTVQETAKTTTGRFGLGPVVRTTTLLMSAAGVARTMLGPRRAPTRAEARQQRREEVDQQIAARMEQSTGQAQSRRQTT
jgi:ABC-type multidrug transport system fused ATPase/permease subunit